MISRLALLTCLTILSTGCRNAVLNINLGSGPAPQGDEAPAANPPAAAADQATGAPALACWPDSTAFKAEQRAHGYAKEAWPATADFLARLAPVKAQHPVCPPK